MQRGASFILKLNQRTRKQFFTEMRRISLHNGWCNTELTQGFDGEIGKGIGGTLRSVVPTSKGMYRTLNRTWRKQFRFWRIKNFSASTTWTQVYNRNQVGGTKIFNSPQVISDGSSARLESETTAAESEAVRRKSSSTDCDDVYCLNFRVQHSGEAVTTANSYGTDQWVADGMWRKMKWTWTCRTRRQCCTTNYLASARRAPLCRNNGKAHRRSPASSAGIQCVEVLRGHLSARCTVFTNSATLWTAVKSREPRRPWAQSALVEGEC